MKRIYIAGPMRGVEDFNRAAFTEHAAKLRALGWAVENPVEIGGRFDGRNRARRRVFWQSVEKVSINPSPQKGITTYPRRMKRRGGAFSCVWCDSTREG